MPRRAVLKPQGYVFILPEHVNAPVQHPGYGQVTHMDASTVAISMMDSGRTVSVSPELASPHSHEE